MRKRKTHAHSPADKKRADEMLDAVTKKFAADPLRFIALGLLVAMGLKQQVPVQVLVKAIRDLNAEPLTDDVLALSENPKTV